ncbi:MAG TPA: AI-2E family transporter [Candidatus Limnocylindria bacterium]|nr:AI-2E family transporter [Candidatus Limnocylindria bacterium]
MSLQRPTPTQSRLMWLSLSAFAVAVLIGLAVATIWSAGQVLRILSPVLWPLAVGGVLSYLLDPVVTYLARRGMRRRRAILLVFVTGVLLVAGLFASIVPQIYTESRQLAERIPGYATKLQAQINHWATDPPVIVKRFLQARAQLNVAPPEPPPAAPANSLDREPDATEMPRTVTTNTVPATPTGDAAKSGRLDPETIRKASSWIANAIPDASTWLLSQIGKATSWIGFVAGFMLVPVYTFYFLVEKRSIESQWAIFIPLRNSWIKNEVAFVIGAINDYLIVFFRSQVLVSICNGIMYTVGFLAIDLPYAFLLGVMAVALTLIPFIGSISICVLALIIAFASTGNWRQPALVLLVVAIVQAVESLVISPKIIGDRVGLHPLAIIIAVMIGTTVLGGFLGGLLAIPLAAALRVIMFRYVWQRSPAAAVVEAAPEPTGGAK